MSALRATLDSALLAGLLVDGLSATELGSAVHDLLERIDLAAPDAPDVDAVRERYPSATADDDSPCGSSSTTTPDTPSRWS